MKKRLTIELETENEVSAVMKFKSKCYGLGRNMKDVMMELIKKYLEE